MNKQVRRIFVEKKKEYAVEAGVLLSDIREFLGIQQLQALRVINRYDVSGLSEEEYSQAQTTIFSEPTVDEIHNEIMTFNDSDRVFAIEYLPGQYDQRADSAAQCAQILTQKERPEVRTAKIIVLSGRLSDEDFKSIKAYCINPLESKEASMSKPDTLDTFSDAPSDIEIYNNFIHMTEQELKAFMDKMGFAMSFDDLEFCQTYFKETEKRNPTATELKVIDTYWSDHCRHTTFHTAIDAVSIEDGLYTQPINEAYQMYKESRKIVYGNEKRDVCLMDLAVIAMKELRKQGRLNDLEVSEEVNACSIIVDADINGEKEEWLVMFKNETHNHPTEIEPFGGAATCLGGAIRDPLSGRSYVYGAMRVTGSGDPRKSVLDTIPGKLPQRKITTGAAAGYSSYGNQIGLATGQVAEIYNEGFVAKRMEIGAVIGAAPRANVVRDTPEAGDVIVLLGGRTGRDGCGGATGSSKEHTEESLATCSAEVQKGNAPTERKIQRLFRDPKVSQMIKRCNDFGAGGVSVAIGELADGLRIDLDKVPKKYDGLDGTELAISESQERMAVAIDKSDLETFVKYANEENLEAVKVAEVTSDNRLIMLWRGKEIVDVSRDFLNTNGVRQHTKVHVTAPEKDNTVFASEAAAISNQTSDIKKAWLENLKDINVCCQKGLVERFDSTVGAGTVLMPFGGKHQATPAEGLAMKLPVGQAETKTGTLMAFGYNPRLAKWSPFHGAFYAVLEAASKVVAMGGDYRKIRLTLQEYFEKLGKDQAKWGKPFSALLGALYAQKIFEMPAIGGKDSMSGTFKDMNVPPTLVAFALAATDISKVVSAEFKKAGSQVVMLTSERAENELPNIEQLKKNFAKVHELILLGNVLSASTVKYGGLAATISKMCFGNNIGISLNQNVMKNELFTAEYGSLILELQADCDLAALLEGSSYKVIGSTTDKSTIEYNGVNIDLEEAYQAWFRPLEKVFPTQTQALEKNIEIPLYHKGICKKSTIKTAKPRVLIPVFPGTNCEYDTQKAFEKAGAIAETLVFRNLTSSDIEYSIDLMTQSIEKSQIIAIPGGFSAGDEPDGSGKFIATVFRNPRIKEAVMRLLKQRDGLMLGICNGFQALIKLGLLPYGEILDITEACPTLTYNQIGRHMSRMVNTKIVSNLSPWFNHASVGDIHNIAISHGEGRFAANEELVNKLIANGQIATVYVDHDGKPTSDIAFNPNGSTFAVEGITSPDGRVFGKMGHSERMGSYIGKNVPGNKDQRIFEAGVDYFK